MRKFAALALVLLLGASTVSVANAQAGKSGGQSAVTPNEADNIFDTLYGFFVGAEQPGASYYRQKLEFEAPRMKRTRRGPAPGSFRDDPSAAGGGD